MGQGAKREKNSCLWKEHKVWMQSNDMCNACFELYMYGSSNVHTYKLKTSGVCFEKYPETIENWIPYDQTADFWRKRLESTTTTTTTAATTATATTAAALSTNAARTKRKRDPINHFVAEPSCQRLNCERQPSLYCKRKDKQNVNKDKILSTISSLSAKDLTGIISPIITMAQKTRDGRFAFAKKIRKVGGNEGPMRLSTNGTSSTAVSLYSKTYQEASIGLATMLDPSNPKTAFVRLKDARSPLGYRQATRMNHQQQVVDTTVRKLGTIPEERLLFQQQQLNPPPRRLLQELEQPTEDDTTSDERGEQFEIHESPEQDTRLGRRSMTKVPVHKILAAKNAIGPPQMEHLQSLSTNAERRPFFAAMHCGGHSRPAINRATEIYNNKKEWNKIGIYFLWPGPYVPVEKPQIF